MDAAVEKTGAIQERDEFDGPHLFWPLPSREGLRPIVLAFFAIPTVGWTIGLIAAIQTLIVDPDLVAIGWLALWVACGGVYPLGLRATLRLRPESVLLGQGHLVYDRGWNLVSEPFLMGLSAGLHPLFVRPITVLKSEIAGFALVDAEPRHQLILDRAGKRIEIGAVLGERDREWLFNVLQDWWKQ